MDIAIYKGIKFIKISNKEDKIDFKNLKINNLTIIKFNEFRNLFNTKIQTFINCLEIEKKNLTYYFKKILLRKSQIFYFNSAVIKSNEKLNLKTNDLSFIYLKNL